MSSCNLSCLGLRAMWVLSWPPWSLLPDLPSEEFSGSICLGRGVGISWSRGYSNTSSLFSKRGTIIVMSLLWLHSIKLCLTITTTRAHLQVALLLLSILTTNWFNNPAHGGTKWLSNVTIRERELTFVGWKISTPIILLTVSDSVFFSAVEWI